MNRSLEVMNSDDEIMMWQQRISDPTIVGPVFSVLDNTWYLDTRSRTEPNSVRTVPGAEYNRQTKLYALPSVASALCELSAAELKRRQNVRAAGTSVLRLVDRAEDIDFSKLVDPVSRENLVPALAIDESLVASEGLWGSVRMVGFANREALEVTMETGLATFYSRSSQSLWTKGEESGNTMVINRILSDCDSDTLIYDVFANGPTCHTGAASCFEQPGDER